MPALLTFSGAVERDPAIDQWLEARTDARGAIACQWFKLIRACGNDVRELMHDGCPTVCVQDAAFAYVNAFRAHVNIGFFQGASLADSAGLLEGTGKYMRHVKVKPGHPINASALEELIRASYRDIVARLQAIN